MIHQHAARVVGRYSVVAVLFSFLLIIPQLQCSHFDKNPVSASQESSRLIGKTAELVVGSTKTMTSGDNAIKASLTGMGLTVTLKVDDSVAPKDTAFSIIIISGTCDPFNIGSMFKSTGKPVICLLPGLYSSMAMTGGSASNYGYVNGSSITIPDSTPVMADYLKGPVSITLGGDSIGWGLPNANADTIATAAAGKYAIFDYNKGVLMFGGFTAPARRVGFFMSNQAAADPTTSYMFALFGRAVAWALNLNDLNNAPIVSLTAPKAGTKYLLCDSIVVTATASDVDGVVKVVRFTCNDSLFDSATAAPYRGVLRNFTAAKICTLRVIAVDDSNGVGQSSTSIVTVRHTIPSVSVTTPITASLYKLFDTVTVTAKVIDSDKTLDSVYFYDSSAASTSWLKLDSLGVNDTTSKGIYTTKYKHLSAGVYKVKATVIDLLDSTRTSTVISFTVRNRVPSVSVTSPVLNTLFKMYDTLHVTAKCVDSNGTLDTVIFYDSLAGAAWVAFDTLFATDSAKGGVYTTKKIDSLKAQGMHYVRAKVIDKYDSMRTSTSIAINVRNRIPSVAISSPAVNTLFKMYDTLHVTAKCVDSNGTLDTVIFYDSLAAGTWRAFDTLFATDSAKGGLYTTKKIDSLKAQGIHYVRAKVIDKYDSMRISTSIAINIRNRIPSVAVSSPAANTLFKMYDTLHVTAKCVDSNSTLDTVIFYDSLAGATWVAFDTLFATDSAKGGLYTTKKIDSLKAQGMHYLRARVIDKYDSMRTSTSVAINVRNRVPSVAISSPAANTLFKMYDTLHVTAKCVDSNSTLDTVIFYDSLAGGAWRAFDTLFASDSAKGGLYTTKKIDSLKAQGMHYLRAKVIDKYDSMRTSVSVAINVRNRIPSVAISSPAANTLFKMYDTLHVTAKCVDSNGTLDTVIFYDSLAGGAWVAIDTLFATDSAKGGLYTMKKIDSLKAQGTHYLRARVIDKYDSMRTSTSIAISVRNRIPSVAISSPAANTLFKMYDTLHVTAKCVDSNGTLDTVIFYDSLAGATWVAFDTLFATDSAKGGLYTTKKIDSLKTMGMHYLRAKVIDKYDSMRTSTSIAINVRNRIPSVAINSPAANTLFKMYDTLHVTAKCVDSNGTLDTVIFYDSLAGGTWRAFDTLYAADSAKGGLYTTKKIDSLKAVGMHYLRARVIDKYDSMRTSTSIAINVRNRIPSIAISSPAVNTLFKMYDTLHITAKCVDSNGTLDTVIFYDSLAGGAWVAMDTLFATDSAKGGLYTTKKIDSLKALGMHYLRAKVIDKYDSMRTSASIAISVRNRVPSVAITSPLNNTEFKFYDTINVTAKCIDSNGTLDTVIFYDSLAGATWKAFDTLFAADSAKGGLYTTKKYDTLSPGGTHFLKVKVIDKYDSTRTSTFVTVVHHPPTAVVLSPLTDTTSDGCTLTWSLNSDAGFASYKVYYSTSPGVDTSGALYGTITNRNVTSIAFSGSGFTSGTTFYVKIYVFDMAGQFVGSNEGIATTK